MVDSYRILRKEFEMAKGESKIHFDLQRRVVSHMTSSSWRTVPHVSFVYEPDVTEFIKVYQKLA